MAGAPSVRRGAGSTAAGSLPHDPTAARRGPIKIGWDELNSNTVDARIRRQDAVAAQLAQAKTPAVLPQNANASSFWYKAPIYMALFGLLGGLAGWGIGQIMHFRPDPAAQAQDWLAARQQILDAQTIHTIDADEAKLAIQGIDRVANGNSYYQINTDPTLTDQQRQDRLAQLNAEQRRQDFMADLLFYGASGMMIALCLSAAEPIVSRNWTAAAVNAAVGTMLGAVGGVAASAVVGQVLAAVASLNALPEEMRPALARAACWGVLGLFMSIGPAIVMRNLRRMLVGLAGGLLGGCIGGLVYDPLFAYSQSDTLSRLVAISAIGLLAGLATGLIEEAAKTGWLKVTAGLIAGKQFVLYRNPTYVGSSLQCNIYLFNDPQVGKRHAAIHIVPGGYEIENLPLGGATLVNGISIQQARLRPGDRIQIGSTQLEFQEKVKQTARIVRV